MIIKRTKQPWMDANEFGRSLPRGVGINLLVKDMEAHICFCRDVLGAMVLYSDEDFAAIEVAGSVFMLHCDHTYTDHPMSGVIDGVDLRGQGIEIRVYGLDPDRIEARAGENPEGYSILSASMNRPHGLRECHIVGPEGYIWVPSAVSG
ncbi:MAG: hypothetical protein AAGC96_19775 [Pseudomonadota bacterium]